MAQNFRRQAITRSIPKSENIRKTYRQTISSFGGIRTSATPIEMSPNIFSDAKNVYVTEDNCLATRKRLHFLNQASSDRTVMKSVEFDGFMVLILNDYTLAYFKIEDTATSTLTTISGVTATADSGLYRVPGAVYVTYALYNNSATELRLVKIISAEGGLSASQFPNSDNVYTPSLSVSDGKIFYDSLRDDRKLLNVLTPNFYNGSENLMCYNLSDPELPVDFRGNLAQDYMIVSNEIDEGTQIKKRNEFSYFPIPSIHEGGPAYVFSYVNSSVSSTDFQIRIKSVDDTPNKFVISAQIDRTSKEFEYSAPSIQNLELYQTPMVERVVLLNNRTILLEFVDFNHILQSESFLFYVLITKKGDNLYEIHDDNVVTLARCLGLRLTQEETIAPADYDPYEPKKELDRIFCSIDTSGAEPYTCLYYNVFGKYTIKDSYPYHYYCYDEFEMTKFRVTISNNVASLEVVRRGTNDYTGADYIHKVEQNVNNYFGASPWSANPKITTFAVRQYSDGVNTDGVNIAIGYAMPDGLYADTTNNYIRRDGEEDINSEWLLLNFDYELGEDWANVSGSTEYDKFANVFHPTSLEETVTGMVNKTYYTMVDGLNFTNNNLYFWRFGERSNGSTCFGNYSNSEFTVIADITSTRSTWVAIEQYKVYPYYASNSYTAFITKCNESSMHVLALDSFGNVCHNAVYDAPTGFTDHGKQPEDDPVIITSETTSDVILDMPAGYRRFEILLTTENWTPHQNKIRKTLDVNSFGDLDALFMWNEARRKLSAVNGVYAMNNFIVFALQNGFAYSSSFDDSYVRIGNIETTWTGSKPIDEMITISPSAAIAFTKQASYWILGDGEANLTNVKPVMSQFVVNDVRHNCAVKLALSDTPTVLSDRGVMSFTGSSEVTETASNINELTEIIREKFNKVYGTSPAETYTFRGPWYNLFCINSQIAGTMSKVLFYDMRTSTWWYWEFPVLMKNFYTFKNVLYGIDINTNIYELVDDLIKTDDTATFYDTLNGSNKKIRWYIISQPSSFGTPALAKTLVSSTFALTPRLEIGKRDNDDRLDVTDDTVEGADLYVNFIPRAYDRPGVREAAAASGHDIIHQLSTMYMRTYIPKFNYLSYEFNNLGYNEDDSIVTKDYTTQCDKLELASVTFAYKMVSKLG